MKDIRLKDRRMTVTMARKRKVKDMKVKERQQKDRVV